MIRQEVALERKKALAVEKIDILLRQMNVARPGVEIIDRDFVRFVVLGGYSDGVCLDAQVGIFSDKDNIGPGAVLGREGYGQKSIRNSGGRDFINSSV